MSFASVPSGKIILTLCAVHGRDSGLTSNFADKSLFPSYSGAVRLSWKQKENNDVIYSQFVYSPISKRVKISNVVVRTSLCHFFVCLTVHLLVSSSFSTTILSFSVPESFDRILWNLHRILHDIVLLLISNCIHPHIFLWFALARQALV